MSYLSPDNIGRTARHLSRGSSGFLHPSFIFPSSIYLPKMYGRYRTSIALRRLSPIGNGIQLISKRFNSVKYPPPPSHYERKPRRFWRFGLILFVLGATVSYKYPLYTIGESLIPLPDDSNIDAKRKYAADLEQRLQSLPLVKHYKDDQDYTEYRGWNHLDTTPSGLSNFHGTLLTPGGIAIPPISFHCQKTGDDVVILHVGRRLAGYPFIVHGGILGMIVDEVFKTNLIKEFPNLSFDTVHTKSLELNYSFPTFVNQFIVIRSSLTKVDTIENVYNVKSDVSTVGGMLLISANATLSSDVAPKSPEDTISKQESKHGFFW